MPGAGLPVRRWKDRDTAVETDDNTVLLLDFGDNLFAMVGGHRPRGRRPSAAGSEGARPSGGAAPAVSGGHAMPPDLLEGVSVGAPGGPRRLRPNAGRRGTRWAATARV